MLWDRFKERQPLNIPTLGCLNVKSTEQTSRSVDSKNLQEILPCNSKTVTRIVQFNYGLPMQMGFHPWNCSGLILLSWNVQQCRTPLRAVKGCRRDQGVLSVLSFFTCGSQSWCHGWNSTWVSVVARRVFFVFVPPKQSTTIGIHMVWLFDQFWPTNFEEVIRHATNHPFCIFDFHDPCVFYYWGMYLKAYWLCCFLCFTIVAAWIFSRDVFLTSLCKRRNHFFKFDRKHIKSSEYMYSHLCNQLLCIYYDMVQKLCHGMI